MTGSARAERPRPYRSIKRQEQARRTRRQILDAASEAFRASGYAGTTMNAVATAAGVSVPTVELVFSTKASLLKEAIDVAIAGDDEPVPILERPWVAEIQVTTTPEQFLAGVAQVMVASAKRADALVLAAFEAARSDQRLAPLAAQLKAQRTTIASWIVDGVATRSPLRTNRSEAIDTPSGSSWTLRSSTGSPPTVAVPPNAMAPGLPTSHSDSSPVRDTGSLPLHYRSPSAERRTALVAGRPRGSPSRTAVSWSLPDRGVFVCCHPKTTKLPARITL